MARRSVKQNTFDAENVVAMFCLTKKDGGKFCIKGYVIFRWKSFLSGIFPQGLHYFCQHMSLIFLNLQHDLARKALVVKSEMFLASIFPL